MNILDKVRKNIIHLKPYTSARSEFTGEAKVFLDANENPYGEGLNRYPDPYQMELKKEIAKQNGLQLENLFLGNGSDEIIDLLIRAFCEPSLDNILICPPTYGMYEVLANINNVKCLKSPLNEEFSLIAGNVLAKVDINTKMIFICSPNNPTGNILNVVEIEKILNVFDGLVVIDEAYIDFNDQISWANRLGKYSQLTVIQTLSKSYSLAGIRLGLSYSSPEIVQILNKIKPPYNVNLLSQTEALKAFKNFDSVQNIISQILKERKRLESELNEFDFVERVYPSDANFLLVRVISAQKIYEYLISKGIVVRDRSQETNCNECLRITIGKRDENDLLIKYLKELT